MQTVIETVSKGPSTRPTKAPAPARRPVGRGSLVILGLLIGLFGFGIGRLVFDDAGPDRSTSDELPALVEAWADAWIQEDATSFAALYAEDGFFDGILGVGFAGRDEIELGIDRYWEFSEVVALEPDYVLANEVGAVVIWNVVELDQEGNAFTSRHVTDFEWDWDDPDLLRRSEMNW